ncbi:hypothetical protein [Paraferrimonas sedimenticola]|uniref:DUF2268 domain-containing protein n=1 Tax=Paraferrimonas sedimenticola TaxID=375674 RepID=A0AA37W0L7_9GAMM|nr:hypothetical protein [Paraferrimonas sedimenticola]GLP95563.1 hypothetical protein GCM10007895_08690 [Paraferrimonas sedimenticola]
MSVKLTIAIVSLCCLPFTSAAQGFASDKVQSKAPHAFVLQPEAKPFLERAALETQTQARQLARNIQRVRTLAKALKEWETLPFSERVEYLEQIFAIQVRLMQIKQPDLLIDASSYPDKVAYFDFDPSEPLEGKVFLNSAKLADANPWLSLALLIHETRHAYQLQQTEPDELTQAWQAAFVLQKETEKWSASDFYALANEFEAFQYANFAMGLLTNFEQPEQGLGLLGAQYDSQGQLVIDLLQWHEHSSGVSLVERYNNALANH